jgi:hypothetical protein
VRLVADHGDREVAARGLDLGQPAYDLHRSALRRELRHHHHLGHPVRLLQHLRGLPRANERTAGQHVDPRHQGAQAEHVLTHLLETGRGRRSQCIGLAGAGELVAVDGDGMADDEQAHGRSMVRWSGRRGGSSRRSCTGGTTAASGLRARRGR